MEIDEKTLETIKSIAAICAAVVPVVIFMLSQIFSPADVRSKSKRENLYVLFDNVLLPITKLLRHKGATDIDKDTIDELNKIYEENFDIIPETMEAIHKDILIQFEKKGSLSQHLYKIYTKRIAVTFASTREKLGFGKKSYLVELEMLSFFFKSILVIGVILVTAFFIFCISEKISLSIELVIVSLAAYVLLFIIVIGLNVLLKKIKRKINPLYYKILSKTKKPIKRIDTCDDKNNPQENHEDKPKNPEK